MKVALCLSGQPRKAFETYPYIFKYIIQPNNADVFIHMHYDNNNLYMEKSHVDNGNCSLEKDTDKRVIELYQPKTFLIEAPRNFQKPNINIPEQRLSNFMKMNAHTQFTMEEQKKHMIKQMTSMYYSIYKCNELKEIYANENGFVYDYVIRLRFDFQPLQPILCNQLNPHFINYLEIGQKDDLISDWINIGSNLIMNVYSSLYLNMDYLNTFQYYKQNERQMNTIEPSDICGGLSEHMLRDLMYLYKIPKQAFYISSQLIK
jgi:hypothetical protein